MKVLFYDLPGTAVIGEGRVAEVHACSEIDIRNIFDNFCRGTATVVVGIDRRTDLRGENTCQNTVNGIIDHSIRRAVGAAGYADIDDQLVDPIHIEICDIDLILDTGFAVAVAADDIRLLGIIRKSYRYRCGGCFIIECIVINDACRDDIELRFGSRFGSGLRGRFGSRRRSSGRLLGYRRIHGFGFFRGSGTACEQKAQNKQSD